jgi:hypothetical protein
VGVGFGFIFFFGDLWQIFEVASPAPLKGIAILNYPAVLFPLADHYNHL